MTTSQEKITKDQASRIECALCLLAANGTQPGSIALIKDALVKAMIELNLQLTSACSTSKPICATEKEHGELLRVAKKYAEELECAISLALPEPSPEKLIAALASPLNARLPQ